MDPSPDDVRLNWDVLVKGISYFIFQNIPQISKGIFLKGVCGIPNYLVHIPDSERFVAAWQKQVVFEVRDSTSVSFMLMSELLGGFSTSKLLRV